MTDLTSFVNRWKTASGSERSNYQMFITELCDILGVERPEPASAENSLNTYTFERNVPVVAGDGTQTPGFIDLYRRGSFVCECKKLRRADGSTGFDHEMLKARSQAERYARALPIDEGRPPFLMIIDVGNVIELYSEFSKTGATYVPYPDPRSHRIRLDDLMRDDVQILLRTVWNDPDSLDPSKRSARVTQEIAVALAEVARTLESENHEPGAVARFLMRCLFTFFVEDTGLFPKRAFTKLLEDMRTKPLELGTMITEVWKTMDTGGFSVSIRDDIRRFNGRLFKECDVPQLSSTIINKLIEAGKRDWRDVEPAIFGTLLERALDPIERHNLGAHYTPRAYVERLVLPTVIEPLRVEWDESRAASLTALAEGEREEARNQVRLFHKRLCSLRVLDPACGSGNFLYVTLEHMMRLEGEVLGFLEDLGDTQARMSLAGVTVSPHQLLGIEINPRAAVVADLVLWIGYLQWHIRALGDVQIEEPIIRDFGNIECRDAVLAWDDRQRLLDENGKAITKWDGRTFKVHPVTEKLVPDETAQQEVYRYINPTQADWPNTDIVVGNPPFIGTALLRESLSDGYTEALRSVYPNVPDSADFVMFWWDKAAQLLRDERIDRFGFITTNSIKQIFNRKVITHHCAGTSRLSLVYAIPDHPWVDAALGAAVRIAMTVAERGEQKGQLDRVIEESATSEGSRDIVVFSEYALIHADLTIGSDLTSSHLLRSNLGISNRGVQLFGAGFIVTREEATALGLGRIEGLEIHIREYRNGKDLTARPRDVLVIDLFGLNEDEVKSSFPEVFQWLVQRVKPERDQNNRESRKRNW